MGDVNKWYQRMKICVGMVSAYKTSTRKIWGACGNAVKGTWRQTQSSARSQGTGGGRGDREIRRHCDWTTEKQGYDKSLIFCFLY